ncbi:hypothetical protein PS910_03736 [Pseudomonas fluorescens]|nr:hypothetical protein PS910_03736 [Pseudomonas fluorescens]
MYARPDNTLDPYRLIDALYVEQRLDADQASALRQRVAAHPEIHPLELLACPRRDQDLDSLCQWLAEKTGQPYQRIDPLQIDVAEVTGLMSAAFAQRHGILALGVDGREVTVASAQPYVRDWEADLAQSLGKRVRRVFASPVQIRQLSQTFFRLAHSVHGARHEQLPGLGELEQLLESGRGQASASADDAHIVHIADWVLQYAFEQRASDIHLEPRHDQGRLRFRIDGLLHQVYAFPASVTLALVSRLKHLGRMNVAEKRRPQDGRLKSRLPSGEEIEVRLSTLPTPFGEKLVLRLFDPQQLQQGFVQLGLEGDLLVRWKRLLQCRQGMLLVTGPTGSGKTSTLYASLQQLATPQVNVCTIEDPIERLDPAFNQLQVQPGIDLGFASGVRALLRQDPDIIMIGEIRDQETAQVAVQAALTGHRVLSTLHTDDSCSAITRLQELGVADYLIKATLLGVLAQRLVRTLCPSCKASPDTGASCRLCRDTGYHGRTGLFELLSMSDGLRACIRPATDLGELRRKALSEGLCDLRRSGVQKIESGLTSEAEVLRVCA